MILTKLEVFITAMRCGLAFLGVVSSAHAQMGGESYRQLVQKWLNDAKPLLNSISRANDEMASAYMKLEHRLSGDARRLPAWINVQQSQTEYGAGCHTLIQVLQKGIKIDEQYLRQLSKSGGIEEDSVTDNLRARVEFQQGVAQAWGRLSEQLKQIDAGLRLLPEPTTKLYELNQMMQARDALAALIENSTKQFLTRAAEYSAMNRSFTTASTSTYAVQFGTAGSLLLEYSISTRTEYGSFRNKVFGKLTNKTALPIRCKRIEPLSSGGTVSPLLGLTVQLQPGTSKSFSQEDFASTINLHASGISVWEASCTTPLSYEFIEGMVVKNFPGGTVTGVIGRNQVALTVENNSSEPVEITWNESSFIDMTRSAKRIFHAGIKYADREQSLPNTVIPPLAKIEDAVTPSANVYFVEGQYGGWREISLLPNEIAPDLADRSMTSMKGAKVALFLQLLVNGKKTPVTLLFEVASVKPGRLN